MFRRDLLKYNDYKLLILDDISDHSNEKGYRSRLADGMGCQRTYLSQVLHSHIHLTPDHAYHLSEFWKLRELHQEYFLELVNLARAGTPKHRHWIEQKMLALKNKHNDLSERFSQPSLKGQEGEAKYYSNWIWAALHISSSVPRLQSVESLSQRFHLPVVLIQSVLDELVRMELVEKINGHYRITKKSIYTPKGSIHTWSHHSNWRMKAIENIHRYDSNALHYSSLYSMNLKDFQKLKTMCTDFIEKSREVVIDSEKEEDVICFNLDLFQV